ncbi:hypothetical protein D3C77_686830 [compost metagenome]
MERHATGWQARQQLHTSPLQLYLHLRLFALQQQQGGLQVPLANQAPRADEIEEHLDGQQLFHGFNSWGAPAALCAGACRRSMSRW